MVLAHELGHYLLFLEDTYLGFDEEGLLVAVDTLNPQGGCVGTAMGDVYTPNNTEFIFDDAWWQPCRRTLQQIRQGRTEWATIHQWYPWLRTPTVSNEGPSRMPFAFTTVTILPPAKPTALLADPTFYLDYAEMRSSSSEAHAYLLRAGDGIRATRDDYEYIYDLGSPIGGQNRLLARGARVGDRLCVFDRGRTAAGCEVIQAGDERLAMVAQPTWQPIIQVTPITSVTLAISLTNAVTMPVDLSTVQARLYPEFGTASTPMTLTQAGAGYSGVISLTTPALSGHIQLWATRSDAANTAPERVETIVAYRIGGNPGHSRTGGHSRNGGSSRGWAPQFSSDGQFVLTDSQPFTLPVGTFYTIHEIANLPPLPPGKIVIGRGYNLVAAANTIPATASVSIQYLETDVLIERVDEAELVLYFWDQQGWQRLAPYHLDVYANLVSARNQGPGIYALLAEVK